MNFLERHQLSISLLSPIHIGCGEDFDPTNYVIVDGEMQTFDLGYAADTFDSVARGQLADAASGNPAHALLDTQRALYRHRDKLKQIANRKIPVVDDVADYYETRIGRVAQREQGGEHVINRLEIARSTYDPISGNPILPGSSIKGAIRTALLSQSLAEAGDTSESRELFRKRSAACLLEVQRPRDAEREYKKIGAAMQPEVFGYARQTGERRTIDLERDPLRLLKIADAHYQPKEGRNPSTVLWRVNRRRNGTEAKGLATLIEALNASPQSRFQPAAYRSEIVIDIGTETGGPKTPSRRFSLDDIVRHCNKFYLPKLDDELAQLEQLHLADPHWITNIRQQVFASEHGGRQTMGRLIADGKGALLRVGRHSGAECVTVDELRRIYIRQHEKFDDSAWTIWLAAHQRAQPNTFRSFGWMFLQTKKL
jgi:CRISPR-associated protein Csm5